MVVQFEVELIARGLAVDRMRARVRAWDVSGNGSILTITATTPGGAVCTVGPAQLPIGRVVTCVPLLITSSAPQSRHLP